MHPAGLHEFCRRAVVLLFAGLCCAACPAQAALRGTRSEFARALRRVSDSLKEPPGGGECIGMYAGQVLAILGRPDDVVVEEYGEPVLGALPEGVLLPPPVAVAPGEADDQAERKTWWAYGTAGHGTFATLGRVRFNRWGQVLRVYGGCPGPPVDRRVLPESRLRELLRLVDAVPDPVDHWPSYNPLRVIRAVNALQPLVKVASLAVVGEYLRVTTMCVDKEVYGYGEEAERLFLVMNLLFDAPEAPDFDLHGFAAELHRDVPLYWGGGILGRHSWFGWEHLEHYREHGVIRAQPLSPPARPLDIVDSLAGAGPMPDTRETERVRTLAMNQLPRLIEPVYRTEPDRNGNRVAPGEDLEVRWRRIQEEVGRLPIRWDSRRQSYVLDARRRG